MRENGWTGCLIFIAIYVIPMLLVLLFANEVHKNLYFAYSLAAAAVVSSIIMYIERVKRNRKLIKTEQELREETREIEKDCKIKVSEITEEMKKYKSQIDKMENVMSAKEPFSFSASLYSDMKACIFDQTTDYLLHKRNPAPRAAADVALMKSLFVKAQAESRAMQYKIEYLIDVFPDIRPYWENERDIREIDAYKDYLDMVENRDRTKDYLTNEEWNTLDSTQRDQLALDRWASSYKSKLVIGYIYEMYIAHILCKEGHKVIGYGIERGLSDLGRDIISYNLISASKTLAWFQK